MKDDDTLVLHRTFASVLDAEIALEHLESHGVEAMIRRDAAVDATDARRRYFRIR